MTGNVAGKTNSIAIPDSVLRDRYYDVIHRACESLAAAFDRLQREEGITQEILAKKLRVNKSLMSRLLHGNEDLTARAISNMATAMDCYLEISIIPCKDLAVSVPPGEPGRARALPRNIRQRKGSAGNGALGVEMEV